MAKDHSRVLLHLDPADVTAALALGDGQRLTRFDVVIGLDAGLAALDAARLERLLHSAWRHRAPKAVIRRRLETVQGRISLRTQLMEHVTWLARLLSRHFELIGD